MRIEQDLKLEFQDVLLKPKRSTLSSRKEIVLTRHFKFRYAGIDWTGVPIISANMSSVTTLSVAHKMVEHGMLACAPKNLFLPKAIMSTGLNDVISEKAANFICLDVPNGYIEKVLEKVKKLRSAHMFAILIAGNVVTPEMTEALILAGADVVKVGIGSGAACATRLKTGVGYPQLSAVMECADAAHGLGGHIISDGGCSSVGDIVKAFAAGADFAMLGGMLAGHTENGREFYGMSSKRANDENAGGLKDYRAVEGWEIRLPDRGPIEQTLQEIEGGLRSACSYVGAKSLKDLPKCATFIRVNRILNTSLLEHRI